LETGAVVAVTVEGAAEGDTATSVETLIEAAEQIETVVPEGEGLKEVVADKGYHSNQELVGLEAVGVRSYIGTRSRAAELEGPSRGARSRLPESSTDSRRARQTAAAPARGTAGTTVRASLRNGPDATRPPPRSHEHPETRAAACRRVESRAPDALAVWRGHAAKSPGARDGASWLSMVHHSAS